MDQNKVLLSLILLCCLHTILSAPNPVLFDSIIDPSISPVVFGDGYYDYPRSSRYRIPSGPPYYGKYRYPHFYPPIAVLAG